MYSDHLWKMVQYFRQKEQVLQGEESWAAFRALHQHTGSRKTSGAASFGIRRLLKYLRNIMLIHLFFTTTLG